MTLIDTHCHIDVADFDADRAQVLLHARQLGVRDIVVPAIERAGWPGLLRLCRKEPGLHPALGLHPIYLERHLDKHIEDLPGWIAEHKPVAIGEIGLDFALRELDRERQQFVFERQLQIAHEHALPVILHVRKSHDQVLQTLRKYQLGGGICHAFNGSQQQAGQYIDLGFMLGFGGMLTYERSSRLRRLAQQLPLTAIVLETDAPDLTVASHQYQRNSPEYLPEVMQALAEVKRLSAEEIAIQTTANARNVFGLL